MLTLAKTLFGNYAKEIVIALVIAALSASTFAYRTLYVNEKQGFEQHLAADKAAVEYALLQNSFKEKTARKDLDEKERKHQEIQARLAFNNEELKKKLGDLYAFKTNADFRLSAYRDMQLLQTAGSKNTGSSPPGDTGEPASCRGELNATYSRLSTVEEACAVTTSDFNLCRGWIDTVCTTYECKDKK